MSSYKNSLIFSIVLTIFTGCSINTFDLKVKEEQKSFSTVNIKEYELETPYTMFALEYENQGRFNNARTFYKELYENTNNLEYLEKYVALSFHLKDFKSVENIIDEKVLSELKNTKYEESILRLFSFSLVKLRKDDKAIEIAKNVLLIDNSDLNHELLGSIYLEAKRYQEAYMQFKQSYDDTKSATTLLTLTNLQYSFLNEKEKAKKEIENYIKLNDYHFALSLQLLSFYEKDKEQDKLIDLLTTLYHKYKIENKELAYIRTRDMLIRYLAKDDVQRAIDFIVQNNEDNEVLLSLYRNTNRLDEAYNLLEDMFNKSKNYDYLAQMAIIEFERAEDKKSVLNSVIIKFEQTLENISNPVYENYLAYLLIDYDRDIKKGMILVNKALKVQPDNLAYLDTLAWGEYKNKNCKKAYELMKKIVDEADLADEEIRIHWEKIKECSK